MKHVGSKNSTNNSKTCRFPCVIIFLSVYQMPLNIIHLSTSQLRYTPLCNLHNKQNASKVQ